MGWRLWTGVRVGGSGVGEEVEGAGGSRGVSLTVEEKEEEEEVRED